MKHFKHEPRGSFRLHKKPDTPEIEACKWWLRIETAIVKPKLFVALGATAAQSLTGNGKNILKRRGTFEEMRDGRPILITVHPSALLRIPNAHDAALARQRFREDLALVLEKVPRGDRNEHSRPLPLKKQEKTFAPSMLDPAILHRCHFDRRSDAAYAGP